MLAPSEVFRGSVVLGKLGHPPQCKRPYTSCHQERSSRLEKRFCVLETEYFTLRDTTLIDLLNDVEGNIVAKHFFKILQSHLQNITTYDVYLN